ncbi:hypothetical protein [Rhodoflexus caldus]|uniref:hypothetical protein n=1 Tax=Rhodoflexus caldus TaxID=2891236 RepID=UPI00202A8176|nr:hypothetical protein [Rhodoflexus caldus]
MITVKNYRDATFGLTIPRQLQAGLPPETVMQLAVEMQKFSLLADIGADETLYFSLQQLPPENPVISGEIKAWLLAELRAYIRSYKHDFE